MPGRSPNIRTSSTTAPRSARSCIATRIAPASGEVVGAISPASQVRYIPPGIRCPPYGSAATRSESPSFHIRDMKAKSSPEYHEIAVIQMR